MITVNRLSLIIIFLHTQILTQSYLRKCALVPIQITLFQLNPHFLQSKSKSTPALLARWPLFAGMDETNNYGAGDDNEVFPGNDNITTMTMMTMIMMVSIQKKMGVSHSKPMFPFAHPSTSQGSQRLHGQGVWGSFYKNTTNAIQIAYY